MYMHVRCVTDSFWFCSDESEDEGARATGQPDAEFEVMQKVGGGAHHLCTYFFFLLLA